MIRELTLEKIILESTVLSEMNDSNKITEKDIYDLLFLKSYSFEMIIKLYSKSYDFNKSELIDLIRCLSFLDSERLNEILLFTKLFHSEININLLDDNLVKCYEEIIINTSLEKWEIIVQNGFLNLYIWICEKDNIFEKTKNDALIYAGGSGHLEFVKFLLDNVANIHTKDDSALIQASKNGHLKVVNFLLDRGANIHALDDAALRLSSQEGHLEVVKLLLDKGAYIHAGNNYALIYASWNGHSKVVNFLLDRVSNISNEVLMWANIICYPKVT